MYAVRLSDWGFPQEVRYTGPNVASILSIILDHRYIKPPKLIRISKKEKFAQILYIYRSSQMQCTLDVSVISGKLEVYLTICGKKLLKNVTPDFKLHLGK